MRASERKVDAVPRQVGWILSLLLALPVLVQAERLPIRTYTTAEGLPRNSVQRIVRDSRGFLWFCTADGLSRFDGYRFTTYGMDQGLPHPTINDLLETRDGVYWVATNGGGVCRFNPNLSRPRFTAFPVGDKPWSNRVNVLYEDGDGQLWAGTDGGLFRLAHRNGGDMFRRVKLDVPWHPGSRFEVRALVEDGQGSLWMGSSWGLMRRLPGGRIVQYAVQPSQTSDDGGRAFLIDRQGRLWVGCAHVGLMVISPSQLPMADSRLGNSRSEIRTLKSESRNWYTTADGLAGNGVWDICQVSGGRIWIATSGGLTEFDGEHFRSYTMREGLSENGVSALAEDRAGNLWMGTESSGAMRLARSGFITYTEADGLGHSRIASIFETQAGELCVLSGFGSVFINRFDGQRFTAIRPNLPHHIAYGGWGWYQTAFQDHTGEWWVPTGQGLCRFPKVNRFEQLARVRPKAVYTSRDGLTGNDIFRLYEDAQGDIWIGTISPGRGVLTRWERATETFHRYSPRDGIPPNAPTAFCQDRAGNLWIGFYEGGLARYRGGRFTRFTPADGVPAGQIRGLHLDRTGRLWVATGWGGLGRLDDPAAGQPRLATYTTAEGLTSNNVFCLTEDQWGRLYIGTGRGVDRLDPATGRLTHYTTADGLASSELVVAYRDRHGALWFGTKQGLSRFIPEPDRPGPPPPILITGLRIRGIPLPVSELGETEVLGLKLGASQNQLQIDFVGLSFAVGERLRYQYKLEGADRDWSAPTDQRTVNYASLSPGTFRFLTRAVSANGATSPMPATVAFTILPPVWQQWWFLMLAALGVGLVAYAIHRYRVARLLELERVRTRIATDLHDDIGAGLSQMALLSDVVKRRIGLSRQESEQMLTEIAETGRALVEVMSDIVWSIDPRRDDLRNLILRIRQFASEVLDAGGVRWGFDTPAEPGKVKLSPEQRRHIYLIFKEAITNIVRHAHCASVWLGIHVKCGQLVAEIRDDGCGFLVPVLLDPANQEEVGNGLVNMQTRAAALGGQLRIDSAPGRGTRIRLTVPLK